MATLPPWLVGKACFYKGFIVAKKEIGFGIVLPEGLEWTGEMRVPVEGQDLAIVRLDGKVKMVWGADDQPAFILRRAPIWRPWEVAGDLQRLLANDPIQAREKGTSGDGGFVVGWGWDRAFARRCVYILMAGERVRFYEEAVEVLVEDPEQIDATLASSQCPEALAVQ